MAKFEVTKQIKFGDVVYEVDYVHVCSRENGRNLGDVRAILGKPFYVSHIYRAHFPFSWTDSVSWRPMTSTYTTISEYLNV